jgi:hypothetical protein
MLPSKPDAGHVASSFGEHLRVLSHRVFVKGWPVVVGSIALAILNVFLYTYRHPWGLVAGLGIWADKLASGMDLGAGELLGSFLIGRMCLRA